MRAKPFRTRLTLTQQLCHQRVSGDAPLAHYHISTINVLHEGSAYYIIFSHTQTKTLAKTLLCLGLFLYVQTKRKPVSN